MPPKPCKAGTERHPVTNRCRKISNKKAAAPKPTVPKKKVVTHKKKVVAPPNDRKPVSIRIMKDGEKYVSSDIKEKVCLLSSGRVREIGEALKIKGRLGRELEKDSDACRAIENVFPTPILPTGWRITRYLGKGDKGVVFGIRGKDGESGGLKIIRESDINVINNEVDIANEFHKVGLSSSTKKIASIRMDGEHYHFLKFKRLDGVVSEYLSSSPSNDRMDKLAYGIFMVVARMKKYNLVHGDMHLKNIGFVHARGEEKRGKLQLIDFGWSMKGIAIPQLEIAQVLRWLHLDLKDGIITKKTFTYMDERIRKHAKEDYALYFPRELKQIMFIVETIVETLRKDTGNYKLFD